MEDVLRKQLLFSVMNENALQSLSDVHLSVHCLSDMPTQALDVASVLPSHFNWSFFSVFLSAMGPS